MSNQTQRSSEEETQKRFEELVLRIDECIMFALKDSHEYRFDEHYNIVDRRTGKVLLTQQEWWEMSEALAKDWIMYQKTIPPDLELEQIVKENLYEWLHWRKLALRNQT